MYQFHRVFFGAGTFANLVSRESMQQVQNQGSLGHHSVILNSRVEKGSGVYNTRKDDGQKQAGVGPSRQSEKKKRVTYVREREESSCLLGGGRPQWDARRECLTSGRLHIWPAAGRASERARWIFRRAMLLLCWRRSRRLPFSYFSACLIEQLHFFGAFRDLISVTGVTDELLRGIVFGFDCLGQNIWLLLEALIMWVDAIFF